MTAPVFVVSPSFVILTTVLLLHTISPYTPLFSSDTLEEAYVRQLALRLHHQRGSVHHEAAHRTHLVHS
jgi:hypothetical protein